MFYVYEWYIKNTNEVIYVGKGTKLRYTVRKHNKLFNEMIKRFDCDSRIIKTFTNEEDAFEYEYTRINELKSQNQCVCNIRYGGFGGTTNWWTDDLRKQYSKNNVMKSKEQRERMSKNNPMRNKDVAKKVATSKSRPVIIAGVEYPSVKKAHEILGFAVDTIQKWCINGVNSKGEKCSYKDGKIKHNKPRVKGNQQPSTNLKD